MNSYKDFFLIFDSKIGSDTMEISVTQNLDEEIRYQAFKARLIEELRVDYGKLVDTSKDSP